MFFFIIMKLTSKKVKSSHVNFLKSILFVISVGKEDATCFPLKSGIEMVH